MRARRSCLFIAFVGAAAIGFGAVMVTSSACATARHALVVTDRVVADAVFAFDDAEFLAFEGRLISQTDHDRLNPIIRKALKDVRAVTAALQATPASGAIPVTMADVLKDLADAERIVNALAQGPELAPLVTKLQDAIAKANLFSGGK